MGSRQQRATGLLAGVAALSAAGCSLFLPTIDLTAHVEQHAILGSIERRLEVDTSPAAGQTGALVAGVPVETARENLGNAYSELRAAIRQIRDVQKGQTSTAKLAEGSLPIPQSLASSSVMSEVVRALSRAARLNAPNGLTYGLDADIAPARIGKNDLVAFTATLSDTIFNPRALIQSEGVALQADTSKSSSRFVDVAVGYFKEYFNGEFVDGSGAKLSKPTFAKGVSDDTITGLLTILIEAAADAWLKTPVFAKKAADTTSYALHYNPATKLDRGDGRNKRPKCEGSPDSSAGYPDSGRADICYQAAYWFDTVAGKETFVTMDGLTPTGVKLGVRPKEMVVAKKVKGSITEGEVKVIRYMSGLAGDEAKTAAGLLLKSIGGVNAGPVFVLGQFSFGSNDTLMKAGQAIFDGVARRAAEQSAYSVFKRLEYEVSGGKMQLAPNAMRQALVDDPDVRAENGAANLILAGAE